MKVKSKTKGKCQDICLKLNFGESINVRLLAVLENDSRYGLAQPYMINGSRMFYRPFTGVTLSDFFTNNISRDNVIRVVEQFLLVLLDIRRIGLDASSLIMDVNEAYYDTDIKELRLLYIDDQNLNKRDNYEDFIYALLNLYKPEKTSDLNFRRRFIDYLNRTESNDVYKIEDFLVSERRNVVLGVRDEYYARIYKSLSGENDIEEILKPIGSRNKEQYDDDDEMTDFYGVSVSNELAGFSDGLTVMGSVENDDEHTDYFESSPIDDDEATNYYVGNMDDNEVTDFFAGVVQTTKESRPRVGPPMLLRKKNNETIYINKNVFRIGRENGKVDYCVTDNKKVSRAHIDIVTRDEKIYVIDLRSKNRTFVNERALAANVESELQDGDVIKLSDEEFVFYQKRYS